MRYTALTRDVKGHPKIRETHLFLAKLQWKGNTNLLGIPSFEIRDVEIQVFRICVLCSGVGPLLCEIIGWCCKSRIEFRSNGRHSSTIQPSVPVDLIQFLSHPFAVFANKPTIQKVFELLSGNRLEAVMTEIRGYKWFKDFGATNFSLNFVQ